MELKRESLESLGSCKGAAPHRQNLSAAEMIRQIYHGHAFLCKYWPKKSRPTRVRTSAEMLYSFARLHPRDCKSAECESFEGEACLQALDYTDREWRVVCAAMTGDEIKEVETLFSVNCNDLLEEEVLPFAYNMEVSLSWALGLIMFQNGKRILGLSSAESLSKEKKQLKRDHERIVSQCIFALQAVLNAAHVGSHMGLPFTLLEHNVGHFMAHFVTDHMHFCVTLNALFNYPDFNCEGDSLFADTLPLLLSLLLEKIGQAAHASQGSFSCGQRTYFSPSYVKYSLFPLVEAAYKIVGSTAFFVAARQGLDRESFLVDYVLGITTQALQRRLTQAAGVEAVPPLLREYLRSGMNLFAAERLTVEYEAKFDERLRSCGEA
eukprot:gnl/TRDRNA2_/TRDRNA2_196749_c0_seq1.p1 gnl/TRDRNA2_/TRDRNA2_196749_c0~~gnl/TRDRNA2_/TRDRNA2_196749_c0_seq1.p1  ORF type:complete len:379 (-),score=55.92 gnl/TRDRNA2_/TRDRNA2_196749_c0_seq1:126-1262(-)